MNIYNPDADLRCDSNPSKNDYDRFRQELDTWRRREADLHGVYFPWNAVAYGEEQLRARCALFGLAAKKVAEGCYLVTLDGNPLFKSCLIWHGGPNSGYALWVEKPTDAVYSPEEAQPGC